MWNIKNTSGALRRLFARCTLAGAFAVATLAAAVLFWQAPDARAHAVLKDVVPADGALLTEAPKDFKLLFNERVSLIAGKLFDAAGQELPLAAGATSSDIITLLPKGDLAPGDYLVSYRITSADGHPVAGAIQFRIAGGQQVGSLAALRQQIENDTWRVPALFARILHYAALLAASGGALLVLFVPVPAGAAPYVLRYLRWAAVAGLVSGAAFLFVAGAQFGGLPASELVSWRALSVSLSTTAGTSRVLGLIGLAVLAAVFFRNVRLPDPAARGPLWTLLLAGALAGPLGFVLSGHIATAEPKWFIAPLIAAHVVAGTFWVGALYPLFASVRHGAHDEAVRTLVAFSQRAAAVIAVLLAAGLIMAYVQLENWAGFATGYGVRLAIKLAFVAGMLAIAFANRTRLTPFFEQGVAWAQTWLSRALLADVAIAAGVVIATATLSLDPPPRNINMMAGHAIEDPTGTKRGSSAGHGGGHAGHANLDLVLQSGNYHLNVSLVSLSGGLSRATMTLLDASGKVVTPTEGTLKLSYPAKGIEPLAWKAAPASDGSLRAEAVRIPFAGKWRIGAGLQIDDFTLVKFDGDADINPFGHGGPMAVDMNGMVMNANTDKLPKDCPAISRDVDLVVKVGRVYARPGAIFGYDRTEWNVPGCARVTVTLVNEDSVRHQWMMHGLPGYLYPMGMFHIETNGGTTRSGTFIVPSAPQTLLVHCDMSHHMEQGLKAQLKIAGGSGNLPSIPGFRASRERGDETVSVGFAGWTALVLGLLAFAGLIGAGVRVARWAGGAGDASPAPAGAAAESAAKELEKT